MSDNQRIAHTESGWKSLLAIAVVCVSGLLTLGAFLWSNSEVVQEAVPPEESSDETAKRVRPAPGPNTDARSEPSSAREAYLEALAALPDYMQAQMAAMAERKDPPLVPQNHSIAAMREFLLRPGMLTGDVEPWLPVVRMLAAGNDPEAQWLLAELMRLQLAPEEDPEETVSLYEAAAEAGDPRAMRQIARYLQEGTVYEQDILAALEWFERAASSGSSDALLDIGLLYANGAIDGEPSPELAHGYYSMAAEAGNALGLVYQAIDFLGEHASIGVGPPHVHDSESFKSEFAT